MLVSIGGGSQCFVTLSMKYTMKIFTAWVKINSPQMCDVVYYLEAVLLQSYKLQKNQDLHQNIETHGDILLKVMFVIKSR